ncbi:MAG: hypothetical protein KAX28_01365 [Candidatus Marinimicrobia bacterium]|jgi:hypothetical protein|nr:hypothetical protein [Candidatus Neomarinimicrobiota bacterium]
MMVILTSVIRHIEKEIENLECAGEECEGHKMWYLVPGTPGNKIREMIHRLREIINEIDSVIPESPNMDKKQMKNEY